VTEVLKVIIKRLEDLKDEDLRALLSRDVGLQDVLTAVNDIIVDVGSKGDEALFKYTEKFEGARIDDLRVSQEEIDESYDLVEERLLEALTEAAEIANKKSTDSG
jgi:histidinol dehydrogenase